MTFFHSSSYGNPPQFSSQRYFHAIQRRGLHGFALCPGPLVVLFRWFLYPEILSENLRLKDLHGRIGERPSPTTSPHSSHCQK
jgi:hypothetical protein